MREKSEKTERSSLEKGVKKGGQDGKKTESDRGELCFSAVNWACGACWGDITVRYPILPFGIAVIRREEADISRTAETEARSGRIPPASTLHMLLYHHELFSYSFFSCLFCISLSKSISLLPCF